MNKSPIAKHRDADIIETREYLLKIMRDPKATNKDGEEAAKLLMRTHHALQVDRTTVKATTKAGPNIEPDKQEEIMKRVDEIINANLYGRETPPN